MLNRRRFISQAGIRLIATLPAVLVLPAGLARPAWASPAGDRASAFVTTAGAKFVAAINGTGPLAQRRQMLAGIVDAAVDVDGVARFCLGRFWRTAMPAQQQQYLKSFRDMLVVNISAKLGEYRGVTFTVGAAQDRDTGVIVSTVVARPNNPPTNIQWAVANAATNPKIIDVIAEGTSLRITQRDDYTAFLNQHGEKIDALLDEMHHQLSQNG